MNIDVNMDWLPNQLFTDESLLESFINVVPRAYGEFARLDNVPGKDIRQIIVEKPRGFENLNYVETQYNLEDQLKDMDEARIDKAVLQIPCWQEWLDLEISKKVNDGLARHIKQAPNRFLALAVVPPWGTKKSLYEVDRCIKELGFCGVQMAAHYGNLYLDNEAFKAHFKKINQLGVPVFVRHTPLPVDYHSIIDYTNLRRFYGRCVDQATAVGREIFSNLFDDYPDLKLIHSMLGGAFFAYVDLLAPERSGEREAIERFDVTAEKVRGYLKRNIFFDISHASPWGKAQLECAVKVLGADHILFGSSYPVRREWLLKGVGYIQSLAINEKEKSLILGDNAVRLFNIAN